MVVDGKVSYCSAGSSSSNEEYEVGLDNSEEEIDTESDSGLENNENFDEAQGMEQSVSVINNSAKTVFVTNDLVKSISAVLKFTKKGKKKLKLRRPV